MLETDVEGSREMIEDILELDTQHTVQSIKNHIAIIRVVAPLSLTIVHQKKARTNTSAFLMTGEHRE